MAEGSLASAGCAGTTGAAMGAAAPASTDVAGVICGARAGSLSIIANDESPPDLSDSRIDTVCTGVGKFVAVDGAAPVVAAA